MSELLQVYEHSGGQSEDFLKKLVPLVRPGARISTIEDRTSHADFWWQRHKKLSELVKSKGPERFGEQDFRRVRMINRFAHHIADMLFFIDDKLSVRRVNNLGPDALQQVYEMICRALDLEVRHQ